MPKKRVPLKAIIEVVGAVVVILVPACTASYFIGQLSPKIENLEQHEEDCYTVVTTQLDDLEKQAITLRSKILGMRDEIRDLRLCVK